MSLHYLPSRGIEWYQNQVIITYFAFFLCLFTLAGVKILHLHENLICRCTAHHDGERHGARIKSISPKVSDLRSQKKQSPSSSYSFYDYDDDERPDSFYFF